MIYESYGILGIWACALSVKALEDSLGILGNPREAPGKLQDNSGKTWANLGKPGQTWANLGKPGQTLACLEYSGESSRALTDKAQAQIPRMP